MLRRKRDPLTEESATKHFCLFSSSLRAHLSFFFLLLSQRTENTTQLCPFFVWSALIPNSTLFYGAEKVCCKAKYETEISQSGCGRGVELLKWGKKIQTPFWCFCWCLLLELIFPKYRLAERKKNKNRDRLGKSLFLFCLFRAPLVRKEEEKN